ncbi:MAG: beta-ketoacyl-ACP synthase II [Solirubrobacteraceae bacterium]|nr:beta-ketoacyl-ACP synthase II [Patulibacter sp.]
MTRQPVVVTGVGAVTPLGTTARALHDGWLQARTGIVDGLARCIEFDPADILTFKETRRTDRFTQLAVAAAGEAMAHAGGDAFDGARAGCIVGTGIGGLGTIEASQAVFAEKGPERVSPLAIPMMMSNAAPAAVAMRHGIRGPVFGVVSACVAGAHAIGTALQLLRAGAADIVLAGGAESALTPLAQAGFGVLDATSTVGVSRPFDARRDGFVMGEGAGFLVLETQEHAERRGAEPLAVLSGYAATNDAHHLTAPREDGAVAAEAMRLALADAGRSPADVSYLSAHGTSTPLNDAAETQAVKRALGEHAATVPISSAKSVIGHLLGAAGAVEAVAAVLALDARRAGPTVGWSVRDPDLDLDYIPDAPRSLGSGRLVALSNSFGFGGHNAVLCLERT